MYRLDYQTINLIYDYIGLKEQLKQYFKNTVLIQLLDHIYHSAKTASRLSEYPNLLVREIEGIIQVLQPPAKYKSWDQVEALLISRKTKARTILSLLKNYDVNCIPFLEELEKYAHVLDLFNDDIQAKLWTAVNQYYGAIQFATGWDDPVYPFGLGPDPDYGPVHDRFVALC